MKPYFDACDEQVRLFVATIDRAKLLFVEVVLATRRAAGQQPPGETPNGGDMPPVVQ